MEATDKPITEAEGFEIIQKMINTVKSEIDDNTFYNLLWGWLVFIASLGHFILMKAGYEYPYVTWFLMIAGAIASVAYGSRQDRKKKVRTYIDDLMKYVLIAFLVSLAIVLLNMQRLQLGTYPMVMMVYGIWLFVCGGAIRYRPLMAGGIINWILGSVAFFVFFDTQLLLLALAVLLGYIIPSYMFRKQRGVHV